jgi:hypothetical protein
MPEGADNHDDKAAAEAALVEKARAMESTLAMRARDAERTRISGMPGSIARYSQRATAG